MQQKPKAPIFSRKEQRLLIRIGAVLAVIFLCTVLISAVGYYTGIDVAPSEQAITEATAGQSLLAASKPTGTPRPTATPRPTETPLPTATPLPGVGDAVILDGVTLRVVRAEDAGQTFSTDERETPIETSGMFVWLSVQITNTGSDPIALHAPNLTDGAGREFNTHEDSVWYMPHDELCTFDTLNPGLTKTCSYVFELPSDATGLAALLKTSLFRDGVRVNLTP